MKKARPAHDWQFVGNAGAMDEYRDYKCKKCGATVRCVEYPNPVLYDDPCPGKKM